VKIKKKITSRLTTQRMVFGILNRTSIKKEPQKKTISQLSAMTRQDILTVPLFLSNVFPFYSTFFTPNAGTMGSMAVCSD
jgi:hypothetical protein